MTTITPTFNVLILSDTIDSAAIALHTYHRLKRGLDSEYDFSLQVWRFDVLNPDRWPGATRGVAEADMVIVAWGGHESGLSSLRAWTEQWPASFERGRRALVALFTGPRGATAETAFTAEQGFLQSLADRTSMDLLSAPEVPDEEIGPGTEWKEEPALSGAMPDTGGGLHEWWGAPRPMTGPSLHRVADSCSRASLPASSNPARWSSCAVKRMTLMLPVEQTSVSPARHLPDPALCRARDHRMAEFADCLVDRPYECRYAVSFGRDYFCHHPQWHEIAARTAAPAPVESHQATDAPSHALGRWDERGHRDGIMQEGPHRFVSGL